MVALMISHACSGRMVPGVTMWEVFSGGKKPYGGVDPMNLPRMLEDGVRLDKPNTPACSEAT